MDTDWTKIAFKRAQRMSDNQGKVEVQNLEAYGSVRGACIGLMNDLDSELFMTSKDHLVSHSHLPSNRWDFAPYNPATFFAAPEEGVYSIEGLEALGMHIADSVGLLFGHYEKPSERTNAFPAMLSLPHYLSLIHI